MRYVIIGFCVFMAACAGTTPTAPTSSLSPISFKGTYEGVETVDATVPSLHHLVDVTGNATALGRFTVTAQWTVTAAGAIETSSTWRAANGDEFYTSFSRSGVQTPPTITFTETHRIIGGTGRFASASGTFTVVQTRGLSMPYNNSATIDGTISLGH